MAVEADYVFTGSRQDQVRQNANLAYNPATGVNYPFADISKRPYPAWGDVVMQVTDDRNNYHALQTSFSKRMSRGWQASATYTLSGQWNYQRPPVNPGCKYPMTMPSAGVFACDVPIALHPVLAGEWYLSGDQRNRATFNGIWQLRYGFQLSGLYLYGDNGKATPTSGVDVLQTGGSGGRVRPDGTLIPRNSFERAAIHRVDMRIQRRFPLGGRAGIDGILEVFNVFNHANYNSWVTVQSNARYGQPQQDTNLAYSPRMLQLGFRATF